MFLCLVKQLVPVRTEAVVKNEADRNIKADSFFPPCVTISVSVMLLDHTAIKNSPTIE